MNLNRLFVFFLCFLFKKVIIILNSERYSGRSTCCQYYCHLFLLLYILLSYSSDASELYLLEIGKLALSQQITCFFNQYFMTIQVVNLIIRLVAISNAASKIMTFERFAASRANFEVLQLAHHGKLTSINKYFIFIRLKMFMHIFQVR